MALRFYNSLTKTVEEFKPIHPGEVRMYCCGPTVYNYVHIGNLRAFMFYDLLRRYLKYKGLNVKHVMNITDVDDKTIRDSQKEGKSLKEFTDFYTAAVLEDMRTLNLEIPEMMPRATDEIDGMVELTQTLLDKGHAYKTEKGDIYFKILSFANYGELVNLNLESIRKNAAGRLSTADEYDKEDANDFALWKAYDEEDGAVFWETPLGKGRPGWHIECSVMSSKYLGQPFDIHTGGVDLKFPHHTNEIAQSEGAYEKKFANVWMHNEHLIVNGRKMSKSLGNYFVLGDLLAKGYHPMAIRYEFLKTHYRQQLDFQEAHMTQNVQTLEKFSGFLERMDEAHAESHWDGLEQVLNSAQQKFEQAMDGDLNISEALAALFEMMTTLNRESENLSQDDGQRAKALMQRFDSVLGIQMGVETQEEVDPEIECMIEERNAARKEKNFTRADEIRDELLAKGIELLDTAQGVKWKRRH